MKKTPVIFLLACICFLFCSCSDSQDVLNELRTQAVTTENTYKTSETFKETSSEQVSENWEDGLLYSGDCLVEVDLKAEIEHVKIKEGTRRIETAAFKWCDSVKSIVIPDSVEFIGSEAFVGCTSLEKVYIGSGVSGMNGSPFAFDIEGKPCSKLKSIDVSENNKYFTSVDGVLFSKDMTELIQYPYGKIQNEYTVPDTVTCIHPGAFRYCNGLIKIAVGKGITVIDFIMLYGNEGIETVILPDTLTKLDGGAFKYSGIKYIDIPDSVTYLGCEAMTGCSRLETVNIGKGVSYIHEWAISNDALKAVNVDPENKCFTSENGILYNKDKTVLYMYPAKAEGEVYRLPDSVKEIRPGAIGKSEYLDKIYVGKNIKKIGTNNFYGYKNEFDEDYRAQTTYDIYYEGTEKQWNELFELVHERENIDKTKIHFTEQR